MFKIFTYIISFILGYGVFIGNTAAEVILALFYLVGVICLGIVSVSPSSFFENNKELKAIRDKLVSQSFLSKQFSYFVSMCWLVLFIYTSSIGLLVLYILLFCLSQLFKKKVIDLYNERFEEDVENA